MDEPYGTPVDVYSFGILLWSLVHQKQPYADDDISQFTMLSKVVSGHRPTFAITCPARTKQLIERCWAADEASRPSMVEIRLALQGTGEEGAVHLQCIADDADSTAAQQPATGHHGQ